MDLFEPLFAKAENRGLIEQNKVSDKLDYYRKRQSLKLLREYDITQFNIGFREWLANKNNQTELNDIEYSEILKGKNAYDLFVDFIHYRKAETKKNIIENVEKTSKDARYSNQQNIAMEILGLTTGENNYNPVKPNFKHIPDVLSKYNLSPDEALIYLNNYTDGLSPETEINLISKVKGNIEYLKKIGYKTPPQKGEPQLEPDNDFTLSTIEDWLFEFKEKMNETDYKNLVSALIQYFDNGTFPTFSKPIQINGRPNKKLFGWALNRIFEAKGKGVELQLLKFAKHNISLFTNVKFDENNFLKCNLYKYLTTKTK